MQWIGERNSAGVNEGNSEEVENKSKSWNTVDLHLQSIFALNSRNASNLQRKSGPSDQEVWSKLKWNTGTNHSKFFEWTQSLPWKLFHCAERNVW